MTATISRIRALSFMQPLDMHFVSLRTCRGIFFCLIFRATVHKQFPYSNKTTTHVPSRLVTCAECRHTFSLRFIPFFFYTMSFIFCTNKLKEKGSLRCSFCFHVDNNRATADASYESRLSASRDICSIRIAITVPCQYH